MRLKDNKKTNREINRNRSEIIEMSGIHDPGIDNDCRKYSRGNPLQPQEQQTEQTAESGYFRLPIIAHDPARGEAG